ncbi:very short patch repair endonuclease, partial [Streptomyces sp. NPDC059759]|uniref:very short patch repair endonuclease n=1 Tax=Streptomyces sp. NPDC059759 TaxID=3346936 RepID=UPI0036576658
MDNIPSWEPPEGSWASSAARRRNMQAIRSRDTKPERLVRSLLHASGLRYRVAAKPLPTLRRTADIVFRPAKLAVFIDGCYWHGCPDHYVPPKTNQGYWSDKVTRNMARDRDTDKQLQAAGWGGGGLRVLLGRNPRAAPIWASPCGRSRAAPT